MKDQLDRRGFLKCMAWAGTGLVWTVGSSGVLSACSLGTAGPAPQVDGFSFVQVSDNHIGFSAEGVNTDSTGTLQKVVDKINALGQAPTLVIHTGDVSHLSKPSEFDTARQVLGGIKTGGMFFVAGEHDVIDDNGAGFRQRFRQTGQKADWFSFDTHGVHFIGLWNIGDETTFGVLGQEQLDWLKKELDGIHKDTPLVVFAHVPLWALYPSWGWVTKDGEQALALLKPFANVTALNGHIHQVVTQTEGNIRIFTANSTAFPQHMAGDGQPGAYKLPPDELPRKLGYRSVTVVPSGGPLAIADQTLA
jgi:3',5'-cyclic AMP phosphodiesterase CpdA